MEEEVFGLPDFAKLEQLIMQHPAARKVDIKLHERFSTDDVNIRVQYWSDKHNQKFYLFFTEEITDIEVVSQTMAMRADWELEHGSPPNQEPSIA